MKLITTLALTVVSTIGVANGAIIITSASSFNQIQSNSVGAAVNDTVGNDNGTYHRIAILTIDISACPTPDTAILSLSDVAGGNDGSFEIFAVNGAPGATDGWTAFDTAGYVNGGTGVPTGTSLGTFNADGGEASITLSAANIDPDSNGVAVFMIHDTDGGGLDGTGFEFNSLTLTAIPEPSSTALLGLGGLALIARRRR